MIRRLKRRMILLVLAGLLLASAGLVTAINWMNWQSLTEQAVTVLDMLAENGGQRPNARGRAEEPPDMGFGGDDGFRFSEGGKPPMDGRGRSAEQMNAANLSNYCTVTLSADGTVSAWESERADLYSDDIIASIAERAIATGQTTGRLDTDFFRLTERDGETLLIVVNRSLEVQNAQEVLRVTLLVAVIQDAALSAGAVWLIQRMVKPVDEAMEKQKQFVWDASHELKTPLAVISANAEALAGEIGDSKPLKYIQSEVRRTDHLIQSLLTLARMEKGTAQTVHAPFDLSRAILQVALPFEASLFDAGKTIDMNIPEGIEYTGDGEAIKQLAVILLSNAEKYSDPGGHIDISLEAKGDRRILKVHNTGPAIPREAQDKIFDRFYRVDSSHNREIEGNGLGLAIAQSIVSDHKGKITVRSVEGEGTTFSVVL